MINSTVPISFLEKKVCKKYILYGNRLEGLEYKMPLVRRYGNIVFTALRWSNTVAIFCFP